MRLPLHVRLEAEQEFDDAISWLAREASVERSHEFMSAVHRAFDEIQVHPERFNFHRLGTRHYKLKQLDRIVVVAVFHERRNDKLLRDRL